MKKKFLFYSCILEERMYFFYKQFDMSHDIGWLFCSFLNDDWDTDLHPANRAKEFSSKTASNVTVNLHSEKKLPQASCLSATVR